MVEQEENATEVNESDTATGSETRKRVVSEVEFPYADLEAASQLAIELHKNAGGHAGDAELAGWLNQSSTGGTYRARRSAARMFGLIDISQGNVTLTALGRDLADETKSRGARAEAFLKPALYSLMYEKCRGTVLPPPAAIERMMVQLGVSPKQKDRARQAFQKSAAYASFIDANTGRFIKPGNGQPAPPEAPPIETSSKVGGGGGDGDGGTTLDLDPLLMALLHKIPAKNDGWSASKRVRWFRTFAMNVSQVYDDDDLPVELEIKEAKGGSSDRS